MMSEAFEIMRRLRDNVESLMRDAILLTQLDPRALDNLEAAFLALDLACANQMQLDKVNGL